VVYWSEFPATDPEIRVRIPALPGFLRIRRSGGSGLETEITAVGINCADYATPLYPQKLALTSLTSGGRSVGIVRSRTLATEFSFCLINK
jgi:hypothetical protein